MNAFRSTNCNTYLLIFSHIRRFMSGTRHSNRSQDRTTSASCSACQKQLNSLETGSGICHSCSELYCSECSSNTSNSTIICNRCTVLQSNQANWDSVMRLSVRDLKWFMRRRNIPSVGLIEKEQFVKAVLRSLGINTRSPNTGYHTSVDSTKYGSNLKI
ncbi:unnamed protein product [Heterobilharzia americana]|nr:unnamed protein product [Heterobilharzia americana]